MKAKSLYTDIKFENFGSELIANCPDEDDDIGLFIMDAATGGVYSKFNMTLDEAQELGEFLIEHVKNARNQ